MSFLNHKLFVIHFAVAPEHRGWVSHDQSEHIGWGEPEPRCVRYVAPSKAVALARFNEWTERLRENPNHKFTMGEVEEFCLDACLIATNLN